MKINEFFVRDYLTVGQTVDNFIFENCPIQFLQVAKQKLITNVNGVKPCLVSVDAESQNAVNKVLEQCSTNFQKQLLARDYITALVIDEILKDLPQERESYKQNQHNIKSLVSGDFEMAKSCHAECFMPHQVAQLSKKYGKIELNFFLHQVSNEFLQQAINLFVSGREPYSVKVFTSQPMLCTYYDPMGNIIECPHDFMCRDVNKFIENDLENEAEKQ